MKTLAGAIAPRKQRRSPIILPPVRSPHSNKGRTSFYRAIQNKLPYRKADILTIMN
ncbi:MAG: hypothetical protein EBE86_004280 [Hormoscilla sp. GUM202]|nr:hypothetical protein [Hormoscilla sp. GUM202]